MGMQVAWQQALLTSLDSSQAVQLLPTIALPRNSLQNNLIQLPTCNAAALILQASVISTLPGTTIQIQLSQVPTCDAAAHILQARNHP